MITRNGLQVQGFAIGDPPLPSECACKKVLGVGDNLVAPIAVHTSPWTVALATSVVGAATGWAIEEIAKAVRGRDQVSQ